MPLGRTRPPHTHTHTPLNLPLIPSFHPADFSKGRFSLIRFEELRLDPKEARPLAEGNFGTIHQAGWRGSQVVVKRLKAALVTRAVLREFLQEAALGERLGKHPNVISFVGACVEPLNLCLVGWCEMLSVRKGCRRAEGGGGSNGQRTGPLFGWLDAWVVFGWSRGGLVLSLRFVGLTFSSDLSCCRSNFWFMPDHEHARPPPASPCRTRVTQGITPSK